MALGRNQRWILSSDASSCSAACRGRVVRTVTSVVVGASGGEQRRRRWRWVFLTGGPTLQPPAVILDGKRTPWASAAERGREVRGGVNRHGRGKRRRRSEAGLETRDEESRIHAVTACPRHPPGCGGKVGTRERCACGRLASKRRCDRWPTSELAGLIREAGWFVRCRQSDVSRPRLTPAAQRGVRRRPGHSWLRQALTPASHHDSKRAPRSVGEPARRGEQRQKPSGGWWLELAAAERGFRPERCGEKWELATGDASGRSPQRANWESLRTPDPPAGGAQHHDNRFVGGRAVVGHECEGDGWSLLSSDGGQTQAPVCRGAKAVREIPRSRFPG